MCFSFLNQGVHIFHILTQQLYLIGVNRLHEAALLPSRLTEPYWKTIYRSLKSTKIPASPLHKGPARRLLQGDGWPLLHEQRVFNPLFAACRLALLCRFGSFLSQFGRKSAVLSDGPRTLVTSQRADVGVYWCVKLSFLESLLGHR